MAQARSVAGPQDFAHQLKMYSLAAGAAGVSLLALAHAEAEVIYTPAHQPIVPNHTYPLDLNHDGTVDFNLKASFVSTSDGEDIVGAIRLEPTQQANAGEGAFFQRYDQNFAYALPYGTEIGPKNKFFVGKLVLAGGGYDAGTNTRGWCSGRWVNARNAYLGLKFVLDGETHFGWARLSEVCLKNGENEALLTGYAYETVADQPIIAGVAPVPANEGSASFPIPQVLPTPQSASLGMLATGVHGISLWRRPLD